MYPEYSVSLIGCSPLHKLIWTISTTSWHEFTLDWGMGKFMTQEYMAVRTLAASYTLASFHFVCVCVCVCVCMCVCVCVCLCVCVWGKPPSCYIQLLTFYFASNLSSEAIYTLLESALPVCGQGISLCVKECNPNNEYVWRTAVASSSTLLHGLCNTEEWSCHGSKLSLQVLTQQLLHNLVPYTLCSRHLISTR